MVEATGCRACGTEAPDGARWCGRCGAALGQERPSALTTTPTPAAWPAASPADDRADARPDDGADSSAEFEADAVLPVVAGRWGRRLGAALVVLAAVLAVLLLRPGPTPLHEVRPTGAGHADGRDAARTGAMDAPARSAPTSTPPDLWQFGGPDADDAWFDVEVTELAVLVRRDRGTAVLRRGDGWLIADLDATHDVRVAGTRLVAVQHGPTGATLVAVDPADGETAWRLPVDGDLWGMWTSEGEVVVSIMTRRGPQLAHVDPDGAITWRTQVADAGWSAWVADAHDGVLLVRVIEDGVGEPPGTEEPPRFRNALVDLGDGALVMLPDVFGDPWQGDSLVLLDAGRAVLVREGLAWLVDLPSGRLATRLPDLDGAGIIAGGDWFVTHDDRGRSTVLRRSDLTPLWGVTGWVDPTAAAATGLIAVQETEPGNVWVTTWRDPETGEEVARLDQTAAEGVTAADSGLLATIRDGVVVASDHDGALSWVRNLATGEAGRLASDGRRVLGSVGGWTVAIDPDDDTSDVSLRRRGPSGATAPAWLVVAGRRVIEVADVVVRVAAGIDDAGAAWSQTFDEAVTAAVADDGVLWVATGASLQRLDPADGAVLDEIAVDGQVVALSLAGDRALVAVVLPVCQQVDGCLPEVAWYDPMTGRRSWTTVVAGACAGPTLAGDHVAVPTIDGLAILDRGGREVSRWTVPRTTCLEAAHLGGRWILPAGASLHVGTPTELVATVLVGEDVSTAPVVLGTAQVLVGTTGGVAAVDLDDLETSWVHPAGGRVLAPPLVHDGDLYALVRLSTGQRRVLRLR